MCLSSVNDKQKHSDLIDNLVEDKDGYVTAYKVVIICDDKYYPTVMTGKGAYKTGLNKAKRSFFLPSSWSVRSYCGASYRHGFYCCIDKSEIEKDYFQYVIAVKIKKEWITVSGKQRPYGDVIIVKKMIVPEYEI
jgi:hypothetical protein